MEGYAAISLLMPFLNPMSSIAAVEYPVSHKWNRNRGTQQVKYAGNTFVF